MINAIVSLALLGASAAASPAAAAEKVTICHVPPGNPAKTITLRVGPEAVAAHLAHGDTLGECGAPPPGCTTNADCDPTDYCAKAPGDCDGVGECEPRPEACITLFDPVCGCDGMTYSNDCVAAMFGQNVDFEGECP